MTTPKEPPEGWACSRAENHPGPCAARRTTGRAEGERIRIRHAIQRMRAILDSVETTIEVAVPPGPDVAQAIAHSGVDLACSIARLEAYLRVEDNP